MRNFIDLVKVGDEFNEEELNSFVTRSIWLGIRGLLVATLPEQLQELKTYRKKFRQSCLMSLTSSNLNISLQQRGILKQKLQDFEIWPCLVIEGAENKPDIKKALNSWRRRYIAICVECSNAEITKWAVQDNRIDGVFFPRKTGSRLFDMATARIVKQQDKFLMIMMSEFLKYKEKRIQIARDLRRMLFYAKKKGCAIACCTSASEVNYLRAPGELAGLLAEISGVPGDTIIKNMQTTLFNTVNKNLFKNSPDYIGPGVTVISED